MALTDSDLAHLGRCVELARAALLDGNEPFGSVLVAADGRTLFEDHNRVKERQGTEGATAHPEFAIARWSVAHMRPAERTQTIVYTSGEHCPMCAAAHAMVGLGRIVYATSSAQIRQWLTEWNAPLPPVAMLPITAVAPNLEIDGPAEAFADELKGIHEARFRP